MQHRPSPHSVLLCLCTTFLTLASCSSPTDESPPPTGDAELDCEVAGYPCSLSEVPPDVLNASVQALQDAHDALQAGDLSDARSVLEARADLAVVDSGEHSLRFRLVGGGPVFLYDTSGVTSPPPANGLRSAGRDTNFVVGEDTNGDDKVNNRDHKRALVMAPYLWQFSPWDESPLLAERLGSLPPYEGNVTYVGNPNEGDQNLSLANWQNWDQYDAIFVSTHGARTQRRGNDVVMIYTGVETDLMLSLDTTGAWIGGLSDSDLGQSNAVVEYVLTTDFFRSAYGGGLDDAFVSFSACETGAGGAADLARAVGGDDLVMMGWTESVPSSIAFKALGALSESMGLGIRAEEALDRLREEGIDRGVNSDGVTAIYTRFAPGGGDQRLIEVPTLLYETGDALVDGADLSDQLDGLAGDGVVDALTLRTRLAGVEEGTRDSYRVRYEMDGQPVGDSDGYGLTLATRLDRNTVEVVHELDLERDAPTDPVELEAIVDLPEDEESRYAARVDLGSDCGWTMSFAGPDHGGAYEGDMGAVLRGPPTTLLLSDGPQGATFPGVTVQFHDRLPTELPATLALGLSGSANPESQDGVLVVGFEDANYMSGDGSSCCTVTNPVDNFPVPLTMTLDENDADRVHGRITGEVWAYATNGGTPLRKANVDIQFTVSGNGNCQISDPLNP